MAKDLKDIGEEYRKASQDSFAQLVRSVGEPSSCFFKRMPGLWRSAHRTTLRRS